MIGNEIILSGYNAFYGAAEQFRIILWNKKKITVRGAKRALKNAGYDVELAVVLEVKYAYAY